MAEQVNYPVFKARHVMGDLFNNVTEKDDGTGRGVKVKLAPEDQYIFAAFAVPKAEWHLCGQPCGKL